MDVIERLKEQHEAAIRQRDGLQRKAQTMGQEIRVAIQRAADLAVAGDDPAPARERVRALRDEEAELPFYLAAAERKVHESELALVLAEMAESEKRSAAIRPELEAARQEQAEIAQRVKKLTVQADNEGAKYFRLMDRRAQAERALREAQATEPDHGPGAAPMEPAAYPTRAYPREVIVS